MTSDELSDWMARDQYRAGQARQQAPVSPAPPPRVMRGLG